MYQFLSENQHQQNQQAIQDLSSSTFPRPSSNDLIDLSFTSGILNHSFNYDKNNISNLEVNNDLGNRNNDLNPNSLSSPKNLYYNSYNDKQHNALNRNLKRFSCSVQKLQYESQMKNNNKVNTTISIYFQSLQYFFTLNINLLLLEYSSKKVTLKIIYLNFSYTLLAVVL